ncbi:ribosome biogenesis protein tsr1 [Elasticomyces elasticus]|nr:ribosome biogenesis protein tsr1 [Elasticomyces elasticus]KAK4991352.1 ribosome biogenesis protein tsr1 [Elasticomyces elasticus]
MAPVMDQHHHRSTTKVSHKAFKAKHLTKGALKERSKGKVESFEKGARKTAQQQVMSKLDRRNQAKQKRLTNHADHLRAAGVFSGRDGAPRIVAIVPLCDDVSSVATAQSLNKSLDVDEEAPAGGPWKVTVDRFKQKVQYITLPNRDMIQALDAARVADFVLFVLSAEQDVDEVGEAMLRSIESQGVSSILTVVQGLDAIEPAKRRPQISASLKSFITHFLPTQEKVHSLDSRQDCANVVRSLCTTTPKGIRWRESRSWMMVEDVRWNDGKGKHVEGAGPAQEVILTGVVRGKGLKADRLIQVGDWGDFQIEKITAAPVGMMRKRGREDDMAIDDGAQEIILEEPSQDRDDLNELAPEEAAMDDINDYPVSLAPSERKGVLLDDHHYFEDDESHVPDMPKRLPKGTSSYQAAWFLGDMSDSGSDIEDIEDQDGDFGMDGSAVPADGMEGLDHNMPDQTEAGPSEYPQSEMFLDPSPEDEAEQLAAYRAQRKNDAEEDLEFPDEIELSPNVLARERLARYRGLKSLRTSHWETEEDKPYEPEEWRRLLEIADYNAAKSRVMKEALVGGVAPGKRVNIHIRDTAGVLQDWHRSNPPTALFSLLRHEHKRTAVNYSITLSSDYPAPLKSKSELIMQCGPRRFVINPLFSQAGNTPNNVHKFDRYLHPGRTAIATFVAPLTWGAVPVLFFRRRTSAKEQEAAVDATTGTADLATTPDLDLIATGTSLPPSTSRIIAKRIVLTGHPYKIHKKLVTVRYMFFNQEDVLWFKALQLWTKRGRSGFIKESLGTHGYFKATFDGKINPMDAVGVSMYKRVWPRSAKAWRLEMEGPDDEVVPALV